MSVQTKGLGRGLSALITSAAEPRAETINESHGLPYASIELRQARFSRAALSTKARSKNWPRPSVIRASFNRSSFGARKTATS